MNPKNEQFDQWLDQALQQYSNVESRAGLERRILANLESVPARSTGHVWLWGLGAALAVCATVAFWISYASQPPRRSLVAARYTPAPRVSVGSGRSSSSLSAAHVVERHTRRRSVQPVVVAVEDPHLETFPSPQPLSEQEKLLVSYVQRFPKDALLVAKEQQQHEQELQLWMQKEGANPSGTD